MEKALTDYSKIFGVMMIMAGSKDLNMLLEVFDFRLVVGWGGLVWIHHILL